MFFQNMILMSLGVTCVLGGGLPLLELTEVKRIPVDFTAGEITDLQVSSEAADHLYVTTKRGKVVFCDLLGGEDRVVMDLAGTADPSGEAGLLGLAFAPESTNRFYLYYVRDGVGTNPSMIRVSRFTIGEEGVANLANEELILELPLENYYHFGGQIRFGPDGYLYIAVGDQGRAHVIVENAQNLTKLYGKILRIDPEGASGGMPYLIPSGNPFAAGNGGSPEIIAWGLRNPWRFAFDPATGDIVIGDVGEDNWEELNRLTVEQMSTGANFGWPYREGPDAASLPAPPGLVFVEPFHATQTADSIIGGVFPTSDDYEAGTYIFADWYDGLFAGNAAGEIAAASGNAAITCLGESKAGQLFCGTRNGAILRVDRLPELGEVYLSPYVRTFVGAGSVFATRPHSLATLRYTLDGTDPTESSPLLNGGPISPDQILISEPSELRIRAFYSDYAPGPVSMGFYEIQCREPQFGNLSQTWDPIQKFSLTNNIVTGGVTFRYTTDGSEVDESSALYDPEAGVVVPVSSVVRARAYKDGWIASEEVQRIANARAANPTFQGEAILPGSSFLPGYPFYFSSQTEGAVIRYTSNGSSTDENSPVYDGGPLIIPPGSSYRFEAYYPGMEKSFPLNFSPTYETPGKGTVADVSLVEEISFANGVTITPDGDRIAYAYNRPTILITDEGHTTLGVPNILKIDWLGSSFIASTYSGLYRFDGPDFSTWSQIYSGSIKTFCVDHLDRVIFPQSNFPYALVEWNGVAERLVQGAQSSLQDLLVVDGEFVTVNSSEVPQLRRLTAGGFEAVSEQWGNRKAETIAKDSIGNLYVVSGSPSQRIIKITPAGELVSLLVVESEAAEFTVPQWLSARVRISVDDMGVVHGTSRTKLWEFAQDDWDNDGIPDEMEASVSSGFTVGVDDRLSDTDENGLSNVYESFGGTPHGGFVTESPWEDNAMVIGFPVPAGRNCRLEFSDDMETWHSYGAPFVPPLNDVVRTVHHFGFHPKRWFRVKWNDVAE